MIVAVLGSDEVFPSVMNKRAKEENRERPEASIYSWMRGTWALKRAVVGELAALPITGSQPGSHFCK